MTLSHSEYVLHPVQARRPDDHTQRRAHRAGGVDASVEGAVGEGDVLAARGEEEGVFAEQPVPEMFKTVIKDGKLVTTAVEHAG